MDEIERAQDLINRYAFTQSEINNQNAKKQVYNFMKKHEQELNFQKTAKLLQYLLGSVLILCLGLTIILIVRGNRDFASESASLPDYFIQKYIQSAGSWQQMQKILSSVSLLLSAMLVVIVLCSKIGSLKIKNFRQSTIIIIMILISLIIVLSIPTAIFYITLLCEKSKIGISVYWQDILITALSMVELILTIICWGVSFKVSPEKSTGKVPDNMEPSSKNSHDKMQEAHKSELNYFLTKGSDLMHGLHRLMQRQQEYGDTIESAQNKFQPKVLQDQIAGEESVRKALLYKEVKDVINKNSAKIFSHESNMCNLTSFYDQSRDVESAQKNNKRNEIERMQKEKMKTLIEIRKRKFRQISPFQIGKQQTSEESSSEESEHVKVKMSNLPKTYKQYIKEAKRSKIKRKNIAQRMADSMIEVPSKKQHQDEEKRFDQIRKTEKINASEELIFTFNLKGKNRKKIKLFEDLGLSKQVIENNQSKRKISKKKLSKQDCLMVRLKQKYDSNNKTFT